MMDIEIDDKIFNPISLYGIKIDDEVVENFKEMVNQDDFPDEVVVDIVQGVFKINKVKKEFRILKRYSYDREIYLGYPSDLQIDLEIFTAYKVAKLSGFEVFLENKYSN